MKIYFASYSTDDTLSYPAACILQGLSLQENISLYTNFTHQIKVRTDSNLSNLTSPSLSGLSFIERQFDSSLQAVIIDDNTPFGLSNHAPELLNQLVEIRKSYPVIVLSRQNILDNSHYPEVFDNIFVANLFEDLSRYPQYHILPLGLSFDLIHESKVRLASTGLPRRSGFLSSLHTTHPSSVRQALNLGFESIFQKHFSINRSSSTGKDYLTELITSGATLVYGGEFRSYRNHPPKVVGGQRSLESNDIKVGIGQWDSLFFWEACAFGCVPITLDFQHHSFSLPSPFIPWEHYVPIHLEDPLGTIFSLRSRVAQDPDYLDWVGSCAREFAINNYGPMQASKRILDAISNQALHR